MTQSPLMYHRFFRLHPTVFVVSQFLLLFYCSSCISKRTDGHGAPEIVTLDAIGNHPYYLTFGIQFENLGEHAISEYGVVYSADLTGAFRPMEMEPSLKNEILRFEMPVGSGPQFKPKEFRSANLECYYRAYAKLEGGEIIYGEVKHVYR